ELKIKMRERFTRNLQQIKLISPKRLLADFSCVPRYLWKRSCPFVNAFSRQSGWHSGQRMAKEWKMAAATQIALLAFDAAYLRALQQGDAETERQFFEYFTPLIRAKLRKHLRTPELIEEA